ncbi:MAG: hypothetical protein RBT69_12235, partial [Spirochaetia bacterium]|nr:hypothetical protein [Spirochaetia bacterium]
MTIPVYAQYFNHEKETEYLKKAYLQNAIVFPTTSYPVSRKQIIVIAENLEKMISDPAEKAEIRETIYRLKNKDNIGVKAKTTFVYNHHSDKLWDDYYENFFGIPPLFELNLMINSDRVALEAGQTWRRQFENFPETNLPENKKDDIIAMENQFLSRGLLSYQFDEMEFLLGRAQVHFGDPSFNSLLPSNRLPFMDIAGLKVPIGPFELTGQIATLENRKALEDQYSSEGEFEFGRNTIMTALHKFGYHSSWIRVSVTGFSIISRPDNGFMLGDVFPVFSWHTADVGWHNLSLIGDISVSPYRGVNLFFQTGFDDINASDVFGINDSQIPTVQASIIGISYLKDINKKYQIEIDFELGKTHYLWGNFYAGADPGEKNHYFEKAIYRVFMDSDNRILP